MYDLYPTPTAYHSRFTPLVILSVLSWTVLMLCPLQGREAFAQDVIHYGGTGSGTALVQALVQADGPSGPCAGALTEFPPLGTLGGFRALKHRMIDFAIVARPPKEGEATPDVRTKAWATTPLVLATSRPNEKRSFTTKELADALAGRLTRWRDGARIRLVLRQPVEVDSRLLASVAPEIAAALDAALAKNAVTADTDVDAVEMLENTPDSLGPTTLGMLALSKARLNPLAVEGTVLAPPETPPVVAPPKKTLHLVYSDAAPARVKACVDGLSSPQRKESLAAFHHELLTP